AYVAGSVVSLQRLLQDAVTQLLLRQELLQARVLALQLLKALRIGFAHPLVLLAPAVIRPLADARLLAELRHRLTRRLARLDLPEDLDDLLRATSRLLHGCPSPDHPHSTWTRTRGSDHPYRGRSVKLKLVLGS